jgi:hypothetical protein
LNSGIYLPSSGQVGFVSGNAQVGYFDSTGLTVVGKVLGTTGTFTTGITGGTF